MSLRGIPTKYAAKAVFGDGSRTQGEGEDMSVLKSSQEMREMIMIMFQTFY